MSNLSENRRALHDYTILETFEAGIVLSGQEVKSVKLGQISLKGSFVHFKNGEAVLVNAHISPYAKAKTDPAYKPERDRKLLLGKKQLIQIADRRFSEGLTVVPLSVYTKGAFVKIKIALARGKRKYDKRIAIKNKEIAKKIKRMVNR